MAGLVEGDTGAAILLSAKVVVDFYVVRALIWFLSAFGDVLLESSSG
jgi:hypothetical protein